MKINELKRLQLCIECVPTCIILYIRIWYTFRISACYGSLVQPRNFVHDAAYLLMSSNLIESAMTGKIQDQSVSTYVLNILSALTLAGMVHTNVGQKLLKHNILRLFSMSDYKFLATICLSNA
jgi:hypothetical protein